MTARILLGAALAALASYSLVLLGCNGRTVFFPSFAPSFSLELRSGSRELNARMESAEQKGLFKHWDASYETGINIGVYVGTSCIFLDKLLEANQAGGRVGLRTVCVEPNTGVLPLLQKNLAASGSQVHLAHGLMADREHCPDGAQLLDGGKGLDSQHNASAPLKFRTDDDQDSFRVERCFTPGYMRAVLGKLPAVWFIDCDGCWPDVYHQFQAAFADRSVKLVLYERDTVYGTSDSEHIWEARYREMESSLRSQGFSAKQCASNSLWGVWVWQRGGPAFTVHLWCLVLWAGFLWASARGCDFLASLVSQLAASQLMPVPLWRMLVLPVWLRVFRSLEVLPVNLKEPITGLDCTWTCVHEGLAFAISNFAFLYPAVLWPAARCCSQRHACQVWLVFLASAQAAILGGFVFHALWKPAPVCSGPGPMQSIWEATVLVTIALSLFAIKGCQSMSRVSPGLPRDED
ncbi:unnamed protein product [Symbiodinium pilosum]|uniref:Uncharacterized protein n=1 Tax=Symbiodinium pilosum TaxID=2952 RepID=A0A812LIY6_SYMPI|nr:unnamed protein product [Symbiodinium pilosum]